MNKELAIGRDYNENRQTSNRSKRSVLMILQRGWQALVEQRRDRFSARLKSGVIFLTDIAKGLHEMKTSALCWIPLSRYLGSINCSDGLLQDQGRSTVAKALAADRKLDGLAQTRFGGFFYARSQLIRHPHFVSFSSSPDTCLTCWNCSFRPNVIAKWNFQRWHRSQYRQHSSPGQGRWGRQREELLWTQRKWQKTGRKKN